MAWRSCRSTPARRTLVLAGTVAQFNDAFAVELQHCSHPGGTYRGRTGPVHVPAELSSLIEAVLGLDNRPQAEAHFRMKIEPGRSALAAGTRGRDLLHSGATRCDL